MVETAFYRIASMQCSITAYQLCMAQTCSVLVLHRGRCEPYRNQHHEILVSKGFDLAFSSQRHVEDAKLQIASTHVFVRNGVLH